MRIGFIGLGKMGGPICGHLIDNGHDVAVHDVLEDATKEICGKGGRFCTSSKDVAMKSEIIFLSLPHPDISCDVVGGENGVLAGLQPGTIIAETSTVSPGLIQELGPDVAEKGGELLDSAVSGGVHGAVAGTLTLMVGGSGAGFDRLRPVLSCFGKNIYHCGESGMGMLFKVINNMIGHVNFVAMAEGMALGVKAGADARLLGDVISVSSGCSAQFGDRLEKHILPGNFSPGMTMELATKDSLLCLELARDLGVPTFITSAAHHVYEMGLAKGYGGEDYAALIKLWEEWLDIEVRDRGVGGGK
jgi:2-hydroxymethylglutarate dehydrogenase